MKRLTSHSQNFLRRPRLVKELIGHTTIKPTDTVIDIGAGSGIITSALATRAGNVISYEVDPRMAKKVRENVADHPHVRIIEQSFLDAALPDDDYKIFANIPFHLSSPILRKLTESANPPAAIYLIVQKQFAQKLLIGTGRFTGLLGAHIAPLYTARIRKTLQRTDFWPHPAVDTVLVELLRRDEPLLPTAKLPAYREFVDKCFSRQKYFATLGLGDKRPSQLDTNEWVDLYLKNHR